MKKTTCYYLSLAAIIAGGLVSCQDDDRGVTTDEVRASVYQKEFIKTFGTPAENHQWGFDVSPFGMSLSDLRQLETNTSTRASFIGENESYEKKYDMMWADNKHVNELFELPNIITDLEHQEVYNWFSKHRVNWTKTPTNYNDSHSKDNDGWAYEIDGVSPEDYGSLSDYAGDLKIGTTFDFDIAWVQYVANDTNQDEYRWDVNSGKPSTQKETSALGTNMNYLSFKLTAGTSSGDYMHLFDFNAGAGHGYRYPNLSKDNPANGLLMYNADFNDCAYSVGSQGSEYHNKYIIVYLKGNGYEGWYLGMDYEADGTNPNNTNEIVGANGICNDWIIKLTVPAPKATLEGNVRIMCEDLGGEYDFDFNDLVIDITPVTHDSSKKHDYIEVEVKAIGGTIPIYVAYDGQPLWGTTDLHAQLNATGIPVNVTNSEDNSGNGAIRKDIASILTPKKIASRANINGNGNNIAWNQFDIVSDKPIDYNLLEVYVQRDNKAEWIRLDNCAGATPLMFCVPQTVKWTIECAGKPGTKTSAKNSDEEYQAAGRSIGCAYPSFMSWVRDPGDKFWNKQNVNDIYLYQP